jgi:hypothetical protein
MNKELPDSLMIGQYPYQTETETSKSQRKFGTMALDN